MIAVKPGASQLELENAGTAEPDEFSPAETVDYGRLHLRRSRSGHGATMKFKPQPVLVAAYGNAMAVYPAGGQNSPLVGLLVDSYRPAAQLTHGGGQPT